MEITFSSKFRKQYQKADNKIKTSVKKRLELFKNNPFHTQLNNHALTGSYKGYRSINITGDWRAIYTEHIKAGKNSVTFKILGTHSQLYK